MANTNKSSSNKSSQNDQRGKQSSGKQGFASMDKEKVREIARKGGQASHGGQSS
jgi:uncharacterized protein